MRAQVHQKISPGGQQPHVPEGEKKEQRKKKQCPRKPFLVVRANNSITARQPPDCYLTVN